MSRCTLHHRWIVLCAVMIAGASLGRQALANNEVPGSPQARPIALTHAMVHPVTAAPIEDATIVFDQGRIVAVGKDVTIPAGAEVIDLAGGHVYPGLFGGPSDIGLTEISSVRATRDESETGQFNPNARAEVAVNPDSEHIPVTRSNGVLFSLTAPQGGLIAGSAAVLQLDGWTFEDMTLHAPAAMMIQWPRRRAVGRFGRDTTSSADQVRDGVDAIEDFFNQAHAYHTLRNANPAAPLDARLEAMIPVLEGKVPIIVAADDASQIQAAVAFAAAHKVRLIIYGGYDAPRCAALLRQHDVPVIVSAVYRVPQRRHEAVDDPYTLPARLHAAGIRFTIAGTGRFGASMLRNLGFHAGTAAAHGLDRVEALRAVTLYPAQVFGVGDRIGSLEVGKDASLIITDGDPLEITTQVLAAYLQGREVELNDRHKRLWHKYERKYQRQETPSIAGQAKQQPPTP